MTRAEERKNRHATRQSLLTSFEAISDLAKSIGDAMAIVVLRRMIDGADCLVNAKADPARTTTPSIAEKIFMIGGVENNYHKIVLCCVDVWVRVMTRGEASSDVSRFRRQNRRR